MVQRAPTSSVRLNNQRPFFAVATSKKNAAVSENHSSHLADGDAGAQARRDARWEVLEAAEQSRGPLVSGGVRVRVGLLRDLVPRHQIRVQVRVAGNFLAGDNLCS